MLVKACAHKPLVIKCSLNDHFVSRVPVPVVFFYSKQIPQETIVRALEHVLGDFPLFAGVIERERGQLYINCNNQGVSLATVHSGGSFDFQRHDSATLVELIDPKMALRRRKPLLTIKLNYFKEGMAIGYCWHHSLGDMSTFMEFVKALSAFAKSLSYSAPLIVEDRDKYSCNALVQTKDEVRLKRLNWIDMFRFIGHVAAPKKAFYLYFTQNEIESLRSALSKKVGYKLSRNDVLCSHLLNTIAKCRDDHATEHHASIIVNSRSRMAMPHNVLGNYLDVITITSTLPLARDALADHIHQTVKQFQPGHPSQLRNFVQENGGMQHITKMIPIQFLPEYKNLVITNWSNFGVYTIDFGICPPYFFCPVGKAPMPWLSGIVEGFNNQGLLLYLVLPSKIATRITHPTMQREIHQYRPSDESLPPETAFCL